VKSTACAKCHSEHVGREFELVHWRSGKENFDHAKTGWELAGAHKKAGCRQCHTPDLIVAADVRDEKNLTIAQTYLGLGTGCSDCHADEHRGQLSTNCVECHTQDSWKPASGFSHEKTKYPLSGKHVDTQCAKCHADVAVAEAGMPGKIAKRENPGTYTKFRDLQFANCTPCHKDTHENKFGSDCAGCHNTSGFQQVAGEKFDHNRTGYPLLGRHIGVACAKCHTSGSTTTPVAHVKCMDCHRDTHRGQFAERKGGNACETCHTVDGFLPARYSLDDHNQSIYPLTGSHLAIPCFACHTAIKDKSGVEYARFDFEDHTCKSCHADVHRGQLDKYIAERGCEFCHNTESWHKVAFDHSKTPFPLIGKHESAECMGCHTRENQGTDAELIRMSPLAQECALCHKDPHNGQFVVLAADRSDCKRCHTPDAWRKLTFDHNRDSGWPLDGAHSKVSCGLCHVAAQAADGSTFTKYKPLGKACADCHAESKSNEE
jgi:hypothetical protein